MEILVIRHAHAVDRAPSMEDAFRALSEAGRRQGRRVGRALGDLDVRPDAVVSSPLVRAVQTAEIIAGKLGWKSAIEIAPELMPGHDENIVVEEVLLPRAMLDSVAIVGHEPQLGLLVRALLRQPVPGLAKGAVVCLEWEGPDHPARFGWVVKPGLEKPSRDPRHIG